MADATPITRGPGEGKTVRGPVGGPLTFKARSEETGGSLTAVENVVPPGEGPPVHLHPNEDEAWWVVEGTLSFLIGEETSDAEAGSFVFVPRGTPHAFTNGGTTDARILVLFTPGGIEPMFDALAEVNPADAGPRAFKAAADLVEMEILGPPLADQSAE